MKTENNKRGCALPMGLVVALLLIPGIYFGSKYWSAHKTATLYNIYTSDVDSRKHVTLTDGTHLTLNPNTTIRVPKDYGMKRREVLIDGQAFFEVAANDEKPFILKSRDLITEVPSASFLIRAYTYEAGEKILIMDGSVKVSKAYHSNFTEGNSEQLKAGEMAMVNQEVDILEKETFDKIEVTQWQKNILTFKEQRIDQVASALEEQYGVKITINNASADTHLYSGAFKGEPLATVLQKLGSTGGFSFKIKGRDVTILF